MKLAVFYQHIKDLAKQEQISIEKALTKINELDIFEVEIGLEDLENVQEMQALFAQANMKVGSIYNFYNFTKDSDIETTIKKHIQTALDFNCNTILIIPDLLRDDKSQNEQEMQEIMQGMKRVCEHAVLNGITPTIEDFDSDQSPISTYQGMLLFLNEIPELKVSFDTGNFYMAQQSETVAFDLLKDKIVRVHCKDRSLQSGGEELTKIIGDKEVYPCAVGDGVINFDYILKGLKELNFNPTLVIEHFGISNQLNAIKKSANWLRNQNT